MRVLLFAEQVGTRRSGEIVLQVSPQGDPSSNGEVESWIGRAKGQLRTIKAATEANLELKIMQTKELQHGRVAMIASSGFLAQELADKKGIVEHAVDSVNSLFS